MSGLPGSPDVKFLGDGNLLNVGKKSDNFYFFITKENFLCYDLIEKG